MKTSESSKVIVMVEEAPRSETAKLAAQQLEKVRHDAANMVMCLGSVPDARMEHMAWCEILESCDRALGNPVTPAKQMYAMYAFDTGKVA